MTSISIASIILLLRVKKAHFHFVPWRQNFQSKVIILHSIDHAEFLTGNIAFIHSLGLLLANSVILYLILK